jgi:hypothetical protein
MNQPLTTAQQLRESVILIKPELLANVPSEYKPRQVFNFLRHRATNYDQLLEEHKQTYGNITPAENKALTQGAADVIIEALRCENNELIVGNASTVFAKFSRALYKLLGLDSGIDNQDLQSIHNAVKTLKASQAMYKSWNERYRRQKEMVLRVIQSTDPEIQTLVKRIYSSNSKEKLDRLQEEILNG